MVRLSTVAVSTLVPALKVLSTTLPESTFFSVVRTNAPPLPGLTCWNSTTDHSSPSRLSTRPFLRSLVVAISCLDRNSGGQTRAVYRLPAAGHTLGHGTLGDVQQRQAVTIYAQATDHSSRHRRDDRMMPEFLASMDVGNVYL